MSTSLNKNLREMTSLSGGEKAVLHWLCDLSLNGETVYTYVKSLAIYTARSERHVQYVLRHLERRGILIPLEEKKGRGSRLNYRINLNAAAPVAAPVVTEPLPAIPPTNGHVVPPSSAKPPTTLTPEQLAARDAEQYARHKATYEAKKAEIAAKKREEKRERPGRSARHQAGPL